uniref:Uncharacterized protein n=1 Tax=Parascaris equorum TaxID=6256 RepID=A0A914R450_PAREQ
MFQVRREMESIAADKNKISMEGLLKLEEKMSGIQEVQSANEVERFEKLRTQFDKLNEIKDSMQSANEQLRDKIERQVPKDVRMIELSSFLLYCISDCFIADARIDSEREERYSLK